MFEFCVADPKRKFILPIKVLLNSLGELKKQKDFTPTYTRFEGTEKNFFQ